MIWVTIAIIAAGFLSGFFAGASDTPTGGNLSSMIGVVFVGFFAGVSKAQVIKLELIEGIGKLFLLFQVTLFLTYIFSNLLRKNGYFRWFLAETPQGQVRHI